jgi:hypothetical protein
VVVLLLRTLDAAAAARVDSDDKETLATLAYELAEGTETASEIVSDFYEAAAVSEMADGFFLTGTPLEPAIDLRPASRNLPPTQPEHAAQSKPWLNSDAWETYGAC